jgi:hypothetical protein
MADHDDRSSLDADLLKLIASYRQGEHNRLEHAKDALRGNVVPQLKAIGVANVEAAYSGYGDSGAIDGVQYRDAAGERVERELVPGTLSEELENVLYEFLPAGFEINDGGQGTLTLDVSTGRLTLEHQENYTETRDSKEEIDL